MEDLITYKYASPSSIIRKEGKDSLFLSKYSEVQKNTEAPCFFWGDIQEPFIMARCLIALSNIVKSKFSFTGAEMARLRDPIVTAGDGRIRFEGFSNCAGVYARVDVLPDALDGEFIENGTTNVDFNQPMLTSLGNIRQKENVMLSIGQKEVALHTGEGKVVERKVPLPTKWIKGLSTVQIYLSQAQEGFTFNKIETQLLFRSIPKGNIKTDYYLIKRGTMPVFTPVKSTQGICIGGLNRLRLLEPLIPYIDRMQVFPHPNMQSTTWQLYFGNIRFSFSLSRDAWRGFSGEGATLENLIEEVPEEWIAAMDKYAYANQMFNPAELAMKENLSFDQVDLLTARLAAMGLLGYDLDENRFFYRRLPFKLSRIESLNPRMKGADKLLENGKVQIISHTPTRTEARIEGSGVTHTVIFDPGHERCTCEWYSKYQGERGPCKHVLAVKKLTKE